jgi:hypothetical protein
VVLRLGPEVLEDRLLPESFHVVPVVDHSMLNRVVQRVGSIKIATQGNSASAESEGGEEPKRSVNEEG